MATFLPASTSECRFSFQHFASMYVNLNYKLDSWSYERYISDEADLSPQLADDHVLMTQDSTDTQLACLESAEPLLATPDTSEVVKQIRFMFVMDGAQLRLLQEDEDPLVVSGHYMRWSRYQLNRFFILV